MKKLLRYADIIILICAILGMLLQLWIVLGGTDEQGLYPARHPGWILSWILSAGVFLFLWLLTRRVGHNRSYKANFPASIPAALGCVAAAFALGYTGWHRLTESILWLDRLTGILGLAGAAVLVPAAFCRLTGRKPAFYCYLVPCVFFALQVFFLGRDLGGEPEAVRYLFRFLAALSLIPACYQFWGFCLGAGERHSCLFWSLLAGYLCMLSAPMGSDGLLFFLLGMWLLSNPCALKYLPRQAPCQVAAQPQIPEPLPADGEAPYWTELPAQPEAAGEAAELPAREPAIAPLEPELDADAIIAEILREIDSNIQ